MGGTPTSHAYQTSRGAADTIEFSHLLSLGNVKSPIDSVLPHELTHSLLGAGGCFSNSLEEGLCEYVNSRLGINYSGFFKANDIDIMDFFCCDISLALEKMHDEDKRNEMLDSIGRGEGYVYSEQTKDGRIWYECSQCFVEYLVKNYGMEKTVRLIREGKDESDYQTYLGIGYEELKKEWAAYLQNYEPAHTIEEYMQMSKSYFGAFQMP